MTAHMPHCNHGSWNEIYRLANVLLNDRLPIWGTAEQGSVEFQVVPCSGVVSKAKTFQQVAQRVGSPELVNLQDGVMRHCLMG